MKNNKQFYIWVMAFSVLSMLVALFQNIMYTRIESHIFFLASFKSWSVISAGVSLITLLLTLKYFGHRKYWFAFSAALLFHVAVYYHLIVLYNLAGARELLSYYLLVSLFTIGTAVVYAVSLVFSAAGQKAWLKAAGVIMLFLSITQLLAFVYRMNTQDTALSATADNIFKIISWIAIFIPVLFVMNFFREMKMLTTGSTGIGWGGFTGGAATATAIAVIVLLLFTGSKLAYESREISGWFHARNERAQKVAAAFEAHSYVNSKGDTMFYRLMKPLNMDPAKKYPLAVCLHGGGGWGSDNIKQVDGSFFAQMLAKPENREKYPAFIFVPQCRPDESWGGVLNHKSVDSLVIETIAALERQFPVDESRRYVMGESLGGYGAWYFICTRPEMFAAAIPVCGSGDPALASKAIGVPVWAFHGANDRNVPVSGSRNMIKAMKEAGGTPRYNEYPDAAHNIIMQVDSTAGLLNWLFSCKRTL